MHSTAAFAAVLAILIVPTPAKAEDAKVRETMALAIEVYGRCVVEQANDLEPSGEAVAEVISAAFTACVKEKQRLLEVTMLNNMVNHGLEAERAGSIAKQSVGDYEERLRNLSRLRLLRARAASNSSN